MERYEFKDPAIAYERTEQKVKYAARQLRKLPKEAREAAIKLFIPESYREWVGREITKLENRR